MNKQSTVRVRVDSEYPSDGSFQMFSLLTSGNILLQEFF